MSLTALFNAGHCAGGSVRDSPYGGMLLQASRCEDVADAAAADNCRFDERASAERWAAFEELLASNGATTWDDWAEAYELHLQQRCNVPRPAVPDAFLGTNQKAWLTGLSENQDLIRVEDLDRALRASNLDLERLGELLQRADEHDDYASLAVRRFFIAWNDRRDARPTFAAFWDEVRDELEDADWPHKLRDRLGLDHYGFPDGRPSPIALMRYSVADVHAAQRNLQLGSAWALPTVLDGGMHEFFFPVPQGRPFGATVHLVPELADMLTAEVLHCRIDYQRRHLCRLGEIAFANRPSDDQIREARDLHLYALREDCGREDFGEPMEGRT